MKPLKKKITHKELIDKKHGKAYETLLKNIKERGKKKPRKKTKYKKVKADVSESFYCANGCKEMCMSCEVERIRNRHR